MTALLLHPFRSLARLLATAGACASFATVTGWSATTGSSDATPTAAVQSAGQPIPVSIGLSDLIWTYDGSPKTPTVTPALAGLTVALTFDGETAAPKNAGTYHVVATIIDPAYSGTAEATLTINKATPALNWVQPSPIIYGTPLSSAQLDATASVPGSFAYSPAEGAVLNAGPQQVLSVTFTPRDETNYATVSTVTTLAVKKAVALVTLSGLSQPYDSTPVHVGSQTVPANLKVDVAYDAKPDAPVFPGRYVVSASVDDPNYVGNAFNTLSLTVTALVRHAPRLRGGIDGSLQVLSPEEVTLDGNAWISGDLLVPGTPSLDLDGFPMAAGTYDAGGDVDPTDYTIALGGASVVRYVVRQIDPLTMPVVAVPPAPIGDRDLVVEGVATEVGDLATVRNLTLAENAGEFVMPGGVYGVLTANRGSTLTLGRAGSDQTEVYQLRGLALRDGARLQINGPVLLVLANGATINGTAGDADHPEWLTLAVAAGGVSLKANATLYGYIVAPSGEVIIDRHAIVTGELISDRLTINPDGVLAEPRRVIE